jgi:SAM-dependent methyltransferase
MWRRRSRRLLPDVWASMTCLTVRRMQMVTTEKMNKSFLDEYNSQEAILKYSTKTAGHGVSYLIQYDYAHVYDQAIDACRATSDRPLRVLEFGCGAGMNLLGLVSRLQRRGVPLERAWGTDFSASLIETARKEARTFLPAESRNKVSFHVARNERLSADLAAQIDRSAEELRESCDVIFGVNTFRYCHRLRNALDCAADIYRLLRPGGVVVMIDMNDRFPLFRSHLKSTVERPEEAYLPSLEEYVVPFEAAGFEITTKDHFCWIPHSAGPALTAICRALTPILNATARSRAMRSLVVARKPA